MPRPFSMRAKEVKLRHSPRNAQLRFILDPVPLNLGEADNGQGRIRSPVIDDRPGLFLGSCHHMGNSGTLALDVGDGEWGIPDPQLAACAKGSA
jgi:hypothetical protein